MGPIISHVTGAFALTPAYFIVLSCCKAKLSSAVILEREYRVFHSEQYVEHWQRAPHQLTPLCLPCSCNQTQRSSDRDFSIPFCRLALVSAVPHLSDRAHEPYAPSALLARPLKCTAAASFKAGELSTRPQMQMPSLHL